MKINVFLLFIVYCLLFSCSKDYDGGYYAKDNQENEVKIKVSSNTPGVPITLSNINGSPLTIKDSWETEFITKQWRVGLIARCDDETVLITMEIFINGALKLKKQANSYLNIGVVIKE